MNKGATLKSSLIYDANDEIIIDSSKLNYKIIDKHQVDEYYLDAYHLVSTE